jgi:hypothetical protein
MSAGNASLSTLASQGARRIGNSAATPHPEPRIPALPSRVVPWQPALEKRLGHYISGVRRDDWSIDWEFSRKRRLGLGL